MTLVRRIGTLLLAPALAVAIAVVISAVVMGLLGVDPLQVLKVMVDLGDTPTQQVTAVIAILNRSLPLFLAGLAVAIGFRMSLFNIGVEGQYRMATIMAATVGAAVALPGPLHVLLIIVVAMAVGAIWAGIVAVLKVTRGVSEVISSIMLNTIALGLASYLLTGPFRGSPDGASVVSTAEISESGRIGGLNGILDVFGLVNPPRQLYGFLPIAVVVGIVIWVLLQRTRFGFDLRATGLSPSAASASGVDARRMVVKTMLISGAVAGLIGLPDLLGRTYEYNSDFTSGLGFLGIAVALLGRNNPGGIALAAVLYAFLDRAAVPLQAASLPSSVVTIIQGTIVLAVVVANEIARRVSRQAAERSSRQSSGPVTEGSVTTGPVPATASVGTS
jgi:ABC-type uncharacterized transport system permease subunit